MWTRERILVVVATVAFAGSVILAASCGDDDTFRSSSLDGATTDSKQDVVSDNNLPFEVGSDPNPPDAGVPYVACTPDGGNDGGGDASSPCSTPPRPKCLSNDWLATYSPGPCTNGACAFASNVTRCFQCVPDPDAGDYCQPLAGK